MSSGTSNGVKALYLGSPEQYRGPDIAIRAIAQLRRTGISIRLVILSRSMNGQFDLEERNLHNLVAEFDLGDQISIISGFLPKMEITRHLERSDLILLPFKLVPSDMPLTVIEAMQTGKPIIASSIGSIAELLANGRGSLVNPNRADELADAIKALAGSHSRQDALGKSAMDYIQTWPSWDYSCHQVVRLMIEVLSDHKSHVR
jgi:glycosyltransferase involved in cell wall biosynthesis